MASPTVTIAGINAPEDVRATADFACDPTQPDDWRVWQAAQDSIPDGGTIRLFGTIRLPADSIGSMFRTMFDLA